MVKNQLNGDFNFLGIKTRGVVFFIRLQGIRFRKHRYN